MGSSPSRGSFIRNDGPNIGPGQYNDGKRFGSETKSFRIGETREDKPNRNPGPGYYDPEVADSQVKYNNRSVIIREDMIQQKR